MAIPALEPWLLRVPQGLMSRIRIAVYKLLGIRIGKRNRFEKGRIRRLTQIQIGNYNALSQGWYLWPEDSKFDGVRIKIGNHNYFNKNAMIDACSYVEIGDGNMFGPDVYITDSNHTFGIGIDPHQAPMDRGRVKIGNYCWIGTKAVILKDVELGDYCVVAAGSVVTKSFPGGVLVGGIPAKIIKNL